MKKIILMLALIFLTGCSSVSNEKELLDSPTIIFTRGVEDDVSKGDYQNYIDIEGIAKGFNNVYVIYETTKIDDLDVDESGNFEYYSASSNQAVDITFSTDKRLSSIDNDIEVESLSGSQTIRYQPNIKKSIGESEEEEEETEVKTDNSSYSIGETAHFSNNNGKDIKVTIDSLSKYENDGSYIPEGNFFVKVNFTIENIGDETLDISSHELSLYDGDSNKAEMISKDFWKESIMSKKKASGTAYFDVINEGPYEIYFADSYWSGDF